MLSIAANWGEESADPGDNEPALECRVARMLGVRLGILEVEMEWRRYVSDSSDAEKREEMFVGKSVLICRLVAIGSPRGGACLCCDCSAAHRLLDS